MKKIVLLLTAAALVLASCGNSADTAGIGAGLVPNTGTTTGGTGVTGGGDTTGTPSSPSDPSGGVTIGPDGTVTISSSKMVYVGEGAETIDAVTYNVKKYAQLVIDDNPYFYTYYKLYYLNGKLRRLYMFDHGIGCEMDYKYDEFVEHQCGFTPRYPIIYAYHENGKIAAYICYQYGMGMGGFEYVRSETLYNENGIRESSATYTATGIIISKGTFYSNGKTESEITYASDGVTEASKTLYTYYDNGNKKTEERYSAGKLSRKSTYYDNGKTESEITYAADGVTEVSKTLYTYYDNKKTEERYSNGVISSKYNYLENGKTESYINYAADGVTEASKTLYTYYDNGNKKTEERYSAGKLSSKSTYYDNGNQKTSETYSAAGKKSYVWMYFNESSSRQKLQANFDGDTGKVSYFSCYYMSGYYRCYYNGCFYTYADGKTTTGSTDPSVYSSKETYTQEQAEAKLAELLNE